MYEKFYFQLQFCLFHVTDLFLFSMKTSETSGLLFSGSTEIKQCHEMHEVRQPAIKMDSLAKLTFLDVIFYILLYCNNVESVSLRYHQK